MTARYGIMEHNTLQHVKRGDWIAIGRRNHFHNNCPSPGLETLGMAISYAIYSGWQSVWCPTCQNWNKVEQCPPYFDMKPEEFDWYKDDPCQPYPDGSYKTVLCKCGHVVSLPFDKVLRNDMLIS